VVADGVVEERLDGPRRLLDHLAGLAAVDLVAATVRYSPSFFTSTWTRSPGAACP
jgi:hypothetical protein